MNNPAQNNYIQYLTNKDIIKTKEVVFFNNGVNTTFTVSGINEDFFILSVFQNNLRVLGVGFDDIENNDMLGFLNSDILDISLIPRNSFLSSQTVVTMSYNNKYVETQKLGEPFFDFNLLFSKLEEIRLSLVPSSSLAYKVYTALITQNTVYVTSNVLWVGREYRILNLFENDDFSNCGFVDTYNNFIATDTTPYVWSNGTLVIDVEFSAPSAIVLENTIGGSFSWSYFSNGFYVCTLSNSSVLVEGKTFTLIGGNYGIAPAFIRSLRNSDSEVGIFVNDNLSGGYDNILNNTSLEIRVYN
ncbi:hypothetical protein [Flavobacterium soyangense]|uniref:Uncharacterized protein n=1 Tax=Flavobacterium soyangense TaxID=2023265 RepID=A0A930XWJ3_9FLAO|nr:hypothetical protein [Flavobacterium soyangense]MBF2709247.1 hypothetical protein [Flavobacterium soyangense]